MTAPTEDLIARLEAQSRYDRAHCPPSNPLDAEAAQALRALQQEVERLREVVELSAKHSPIDTKAMFCIQDRARSALTRTSTSSDCEPPQ